AEHRAPLAGRDVEVHVADGDHAAEAPGQAPDAQHGIPTSTLHQIAPFDETGTGGAGAAAGTAGSDGPPGRCRRTHAPTQPSTPTTPPGETSTMTRKTTPSQVANRSVKPRR